MTIKISPSSLVVTVLLLGLVPLWFWYAFMRSVPVGERGDATIASRFGGVTPDSTENPDDGARLRELLPHPVTALTYERASKTLRAYERETGRAFAVSPLTLRVQALSEAQLEGFMDTLWSPNGTEVISSFREQGTIVHRYYDYTTGRTVTLPPDTSLFAFAPDGSRIISVGSANGTSVFTVSLPDGSGAWRLFSSRLSVISVSWPHPDFISVVSERPDGLRDISTIDMDGNLNILLMKRSGAEITWSPTATAFLVTSVDGEDIRTTVFGASLSRESSFSVPALASRCAWSTSGTTFTCGIADYDSSARSSVSSVSRRDSIVSFDAVTGASTVRYRPEGDDYLGVRTPVLLPGELGYAFVNHFDQKPYLLTW